MRNDNWMQTYTGKAYYPADPHPDDVDIKDIAHALSNICRFAGHCRKFYSVAEHSYYVSRMVAPEHALQGLLHDAPEAYCQDIPRPLKVNLPDYNKIEALNRRAICYRFNLDFQEPQEVKQADDDILLAEHRVLFPGLPPAEWSVPGAKPCGVIITAMPPKEAEMFFLTRYNELTGKG